MRRLKHYLSFLLDFSLFYCRTDATCDPQPSASLDLTLTGAEANQTTTHSVVCSVDQSFLGLGIEAQIVENESLSQLSRATTTTQVTSGSSVMQVPAVVDIEKTSPRIPPDTQNPSERLVYGGTPATLLATGPSSGLGCSQES